MPILPTSILERIPGTEEYNTLLDSQKKALEVLHLWEQGSTVYYHLRNRVLENKDFYEGELYKQFSLANSEGDLKITVNVGATVLDLIVFLLSNNAPYLQAIPANNSKTSQIEASIAEELVMKAFRDAGFHTTYRDTAKMLVAFAGFAWWYPFWNEEVEFGRKKNHFDLTLLSPLTTRVFYETTDYKKVAGFVTTKRMTPELIYKLYDGFQALPDSQNPFITEDIVGFGLQDGKVTVFKHYDETYVTTVIDNRIADGPVKHGLDFAPIIQLNNVGTLNEAHGQTDLYRILPIAQELNSLFSAASEIARDKAYPALLEYNSALGGRKINKWRNQKVQVRRTDKGESLQYLDNPASLEALLAQIQMLLDLFHFVALMPKAAAGIFDSTVTSGFQAKLAMQPATLSTESKKIDIDSSIQRLAKIALYLIEKNDPQALQINDNTRLKDLHEVDFRVVWPDNLPIDIAREIQNLIMGIQNNLTSVTQAIDKYNVMMGLGSSEDTLGYLKQESDNVEVNPDRVQKIATVKQTLAQIGQSLASIQEKVGTQNLPEEGTPEGAEMSEQNQTNFERGAGGAMPEEQRQAPDTAREALPTTSTGGEVLPL